MVHADHDALAGVPVARAVRAAVDPHGVAARAVGIIFYNSINHQVLALVVRAR